MEQLQSAFDKSVDQRFGALRAALRPVEGLNQADPSAIRSVANANPGSYVAQIAYGRALASAKDKAAFEPLERAASLVPVATGEESPHALMAELADQRARDFYLTGQRLGDLRRYAAAGNDMFPTGKYPLFNDSYGDQTCMIVPLSEKTGNPNY